MKRRLEPLSRIGQVVLELSAQLGQAVRGAVMRRRRQEVLFDALAQAEFGLHRRPYVWEIRRQHDF